MQTYENLIGTRQLMQLLDTDDVRVVDCRFSLLDPEKGRQDYLAGHIPGAVYADLDKDLSAPITPESGRHPLPVEEDFIATLRNWGISNETQVVAYDDASGGLAARLWWMLRWLGHTRVALLDGGFAAWTDSGLPVSTDRSRHDPGTFTGSADHGAVISTDELAGQVSGEQPFLLIDARDAARFRGEVEPIDTVAGHIPGAHNFPFTDNLDGEGRWRTAADLVRTWAGLPAPDDDGGWAVMCGSGVTACHLALSAVIAGLPEPRLYVGSWSEWIRDPARPIAGGEGG